MFIYTYVKLLFKMDKNEKNIHKLHSDWINWKLLKHKKMIRTIYGRINLEARRTKNFLFNSCGEGCWYMRQGYMKKVKNRRGRNFKPFLILDDSNSFSIFYKRFLKDLIHQKINKSFFINKYYVQSKLRHLIQHSL